MDGNKQFLLRWLFCFESATKTPIIQRFSGTSVDQSTRLKLIEDSFRGVNKKKLTSTAHNGRDSVNSVRGGGIFTTEFVT